jgi:hypothetical protein
MEFEEDQRVGFQFDLGSAQISVGFRVLGLSSRCISYNNQRELFLYFGSANLAKAAAKEMWFSLA